MISRTKTILKTLTVLLALISIQQVHAQDVSKKARNLFNEGLKSQSYGEYGDAIAHFKQAIKKSPHYIDAIDALADTYKKNGELPSAISAYKHLLDLKPDHYFALFDLGKLYFAENKYDSSIYFLNQFLKVNRTGDKYAREANLLLTNIDFINRAMINPVDIQLVNLGDNINTPEQEYSPSFSIDEETMYITRRTGNLRDNRPNEDIYFAHKKGKDWTKIQNLGPPINTIENEGAFSVSADGHYIFFTSCSRRGGKGQCDIWLTMDKNGKWSEPMNLQAPINTKAWESQPSISSNGTVLYFTSDRPGGFGGTDIWKSNFGEKGWEEPTNLGPTINTVKDEQFPFIHSDNATLYFSSDGHPGMGKSDLFISHLKPDGSWQKPKNLGYPINSSGYDWNMVVSRDGSTAYFSSDNEKTGKGGLDIYSFQLPKELSAQRVSYARGIVRDAQTKKVLGAQVLLSPLNGSTPTQTYAEHTNGQFIVPLKADLRYALTIDKKGYLFHSENFDMPNVPTDKPFEIFVDLKKLEIGKSVVLKNIFFDSDKYSLKPESNAELAKLIDFMTQNKDLRVEISGHTDNKGSATHNATLSQNRADAVLQYLIDQGITSSRLVAKGYGDTLPLASNSTEEGRASNRRTEFKIIK